MARSETAVLVADTSAWIEYFRRTESACHRALREALQNDTVLLIEPVKAELLIGARSATELRDLRRFFESVELELIHPRDDFDSACDIYHRCRAVGLTIRGLPDCLIAAMVARCELAVLHNDRDFAQMAAVIGFAEAPGSLVVT